MGDERYDRWFPALSPVIVQAGNVPCSEFAAQWPVGTQEIELVLPWSGEQATNIAHELGHMLISSDHVGLSGSGNLMAEAAANNDRTLTAAQCETARSKAGLYARNYSAYLRSLGHTPLPPPPETLPPLPEVPSSKYPRIMTASRLRELDPVRCCVLDNGEVIQTTGTLCIFRGGSSGGPACNVCCALSDPAFRDPGALSFLILSTDEDTCEPDRRLEAAECDTVCCGYGSDFPVKKAISRYQCGVNNPEAGYYPGEVIPTTDERWEEMCKPTIGIE